MRMKERTDKDMTKLIVALRNFANPPKNLILGFLFPAAKLTENVLTKVQGVTSLKTIILIFAILRT
jgi:hypothetical protein